MADQITHIYQKIVSISRKKDILGRPLNFGTRCWRRKVSESGDSILEKLQTSNVQPKNFPSFEHEGIESETWGSVFDLRKFCDIKSSAKCNKDMSWRKIVRKSLLQVIYKVSMKENFQQSKKKDFLLKQFLRSCCLDYWNTCFQFQVV